MKPNAKNPIIIHYKVLVFIIKEVFYWSTVQPPTVVKQVDNGYYQNLKSRAKVVDAMSENLLVPKTFIIFAPT